MIKPIKKEDLQKCLDIMKLGYEDIAVQFGMTEENCPYRGRTRLPYCILLEEYKSGCLMYVYVHGEEAVGFLSMIQEEHKMHLNDIVILPAYRNNGFGSRLMEFAREEAGRRKCEKIVLGMVHDNIPLRNWYGKIGYHTIKLDKFDKVNYTVGTMELLL